MGYNSKQKRISNIDFIIIWKVPIYYSNINLYIHNNNKAKAYIICANVMVFWWLRKLEYVHDTTERMLLTIKTDDKHFYAAK